MKQAKEICESVNSSIRPQAETLAKAVLALQTKIEDQLTTYEGMPLAQVLTTTQGEKALKANPAVQEFRATVRDYAAALNNLQDIIENNKAPAKVTSLSEMRDKLKVAK